MYIESVPNRNSPPAILLRESYRQDGKVRERTICNLSDWPQAHIEGLRGVLKGGVVIPAERDAFTVTRTLPHGHVLTDLKGIGAAFATVLWSEGLFRNFDNRRQVAAYAGLAPTPWQSGTVDREQGVAKSGNPWLRTTIPQLAWLWHQPEQRSAAGSMSVSTERGPLPQDDDYRTCAKASGRTLEVCHRWRRDRGSS